MNVCLGSERAGARRRKARLARTVLTAPLALLLVGSQLASAQIPDNANNPSVIPSGSPLDQQSRPNTDERVQNGQVSGATSIETQPIQPVTISGGTSGASGSTLEDSLIQQRLLMSGNSDLLDVRNPRLKPPAAPGEYEKWVEEVTGRKLKRFGSDLLLPSNRDYAVPATATIPPDYALNVGDVVSVALTGSIEGSADFEIDRNGEINLPRVGTVRLVGVRYRDLKDRIAAAVSRQFRGFEVTASIRRLRGVRVYVTGFANNPGAYTVNSLSTLVNAVLAAGGPSAGGSFRSVKLYRNGAEVVDFDLYDLIRKGDKSRDPLLQNEDVLFIPPAGRQVAVVGSVNEEAIYEAKPGETVEDIVHLAGGPTNLADHSRVIVYRLRDRDTSWSHQLTPDAAAAEPAEAGDIIQLLPEGSLARPLERQSAIVRIEGEVNRPGNYYVAPNTPLATVLEMAGGLTPRAFVYGTRLSRESVRAQQREGFHEAVRQMEIALAAAPLTQDRTIDAGERQNQLASVRSFLDKLRQAEPDGRLVLDLAPTTTALPGNILLENNDQIVVPPRVDTVGVFGAVYRPASFLLGLGEPKRVRDYVEHAGGTMRAADRSNIFVVHANGEVVTKRRGALSARVLPGDVIFVPVKTQSSSLLAKIRDISQIIFQLGLSAAAIAAIK
jgi:protein involved in polysaccharide export with SLBB domain